MADFINNILAKKTLVKVVDETRFWFWKNKSPSPSPGILHSPEKPACEE
jgi:hypothetical protein